MSMNDEWDEAERIRQDRKAAEPMKEVFVLTIDDQIEVTFTARNKAIPWLVKYCNEHDAEIGQTELEELLDTDSCEYEDEDGYHTVVLAAVELL